jgi:hypothetical protein
MPVSYFDITRAYPGYQVSRKYAAAALRGTPLGAHASDNDSFALAGPKNFMGFLERDCTLTGPTLADHVYPGRLELPYKAGYEVSVIKASAFEAEGSNYLLLSGTGALSNSTAIGTPVTVENGLLRVAVLGTDIPYWTVSAKAVDPVDAGAVRLRFEAIE